MQLWKSTKNQVVPCRAENSTRRVSRGLSPLLLVGFLTLGVTQCAQAGYWELSLEPVKGTSSALRSDLPNGPNQPSQVVNTVKRDWPTNVYTAQSALDSYIGASRGGASAKSLAGLGQAKLDGDWQVVATWRTTTGEPVEPFVNFLTTATVSATATNDSSNTTNRNRSGETGSVRLILEGMVPITTTISDALSSRWSAKGGRLFRWPTGGASPARGPIVHLAAQADIGGSRFESRYVGPPFSVPDSPSLHQNFFFTGLTQVSASATVKQDNREVWLTRPGAVGEKRERDSDGKCVTTGDSIYQYQERYLAGKAGIQFFTVPNKQTFIATRTPLSGIPSWSPLPQLSWLWSVASDGSVSPINGEVEAIDTITNHEKYMIPGLIYFDATTEKWVGTPTGTGRHLATYKLTDNADTATAIARYELTLHDPWEEVSTTGPIAITKNATMLGSPTTNTDKNPNEYKLGVAETKKIAIKGGFSTELGKKASELLKVVPKFSFDVVYEDSTATSTTFPVTLNPGEQTWIEVAECYDRYEVKGLGYNANGLIGSQDFSVDVPRIPHYTYQLHLPAIPIEPSPEGTS